MNRVLWPFLLTVSTSSLCLGLVDVPLDARGAVRFVLPYHYVGTLSTVLVVVAVFWTLYRYVGWLCRRGAFVLSALYIILLLSVWAVTLPLGDRIAIHYQRLDPTQQNYLPEPGFGWFYDRIDPFSRDFAGNWSLDELDRALRKEQAKRHSPWQGGGRRWLRDRR